MYLVESYHSSDSYESYVLSVISSSENLYHRVCYGHFFHSEISLFSAECTIGLVLVA